MQTLCLFILLISLNSINCNEDESDIPTYQDGKLDSEIENEFNDPTRPGFATVDHEALSAFSMEKHGAPEPGPIVYGDDDEFREEDYVTTDDKVKKLKEEWFKTHKKYGMPDDNTKTNNEDIKNNVKNSVNEPNNSEKKPEKFESEPNEIKYDIDEEVKKRKEEWFKTHKKYDMPDNDTKTNNKEIKNIIVNAKNKKITTKATTQPPIDYSDEDSKRVKKIKKEWVKTHQGFGIPIAKGNKNIENIFKSKLDNMYEKLNDEMKKEWNNNQWNSNIFKNNEIDINKENIKRQHWNRDNEIPKNDEMNKRQHWIKDNELPKNDEMNKRQHWIKDNELPENDEMIRKQNWIKDNEEINEMIKNMNFNNEETQFLNEIENELRNENIIKSNDDNKKVQFNLKEYKNIKNLLNLMEIKTNPNKAYFKELMNIEGRVGNDVDDYTTNQHQWDHIKGPAAKIDKNEKLNNEILKNNKIIKNGKVKNLRRNKRNVDENESKEKKQNEPKEKKKNEPKEKNVKDKVKKKLRERFMDFDGRFRHIDDVERDRNEDSDRRATEVTPHWLWEDPNDSCYRQKTGAERNPRYRPTLYYNRVPKEPLDYGSDDISEERYWKWMLRTKTFPGNTMPAKFYTDWEYPTLPDTDEAYKVCRENFTTSECFDYPNLSRLRDTREKIFRKKYYGRKELNSSEVSTGPEY